MLVHHVSTVVSNVQTFLTVKCNTPHICVQTMSDVWA